ncbi:hypothetical protein ACQY0O_003402 [Thecaphora frezii]
MDISTLASLGMAVGAPLVYADQAYSIYRKQDATGFSHDVCAVLLVANITRCFFWLGEHFEFALLLQSILMIVSQLGLLYLCLRFRPITASSRSISSSGSRVIFQARTSVEEDDADGPLAASPPSARASHSNDRGRQNQDVSGNDGDEDEDDGLSYPDKKPLLSSLGLDGLGLPFLKRPASSYGMVSASNEDTISSETRDAQEEAGTGADRQQPPRRSVGGRKRRGGTRPLNFWQWEDYGSYLLFLGMLVALLAVLQVALGWIKAYVTTLGFIALGLESTLPLPQLVANQKRKSLAGFRTSVLVGWLGGDSFKLLYFLIRSSPLQFTVCALFQLSIDTLILVQSFVFRANTQRDEEELKRKEESRRAASGQLEVVDVEQPLAGGGQAQAQAGTIEPDEEEGDLGSVRV